MLSLSFPLSLPLSPSLSLSLSLSPSLSLSLSLSLSPSLSIALFYLAANSRHLWLKLSLKRIFLFLCLRFNSSPVTACYPRANRGEGWWRRGMDVHDFRSQCGFTQCSLEVSTKSDQQAQQIPAWRHFHVTRANELLFNRISRLIIPLSVVISADTIAISSARSARRRSINRWRLVAFKIRGQTCLILWSITW